ncbi:transcriptional repressor [Spirochaetia bacterium]|nr:transcriptional repressor [Spirochaetia bacterium]
MVRERKYSAKRDAILALLRSTKTHPGAQWLYDRLKPQIPDLSLGTVYRNLNLFREAGTACSLGTVNGEERFDGITAPHPHLVCSCCGAVLDLPPEKAEALVQNGKKILAKESFSIDFRKTVFYGLCRDCDSQSVS